MSHELRTPLNVLGFSGDEESLARAVAVYRNIPPTSIFGRSAQSHQQYDLSRIEDGLRLNEAVSLVRRCRLPSSVEAARDQPRHHHPQCSSTACRIWGDRRATRRVVLNRVHRSVHRKAARSAQVGWTASGDQPSECQGQRLRHRRGGIDRVAVRPGLNSILSTDGARDRPLPIAKPDRHAWRYLHAEIEHQHRIIMRPAGALGERWRRWRPALARTHRLAATADDKRRTRHMSAGTLVTGYGALALGTNISLSILKKETCIAVCMMDPRTKLCFGCGRTLPEIFNGTAWNNGDGRVGCGAHGGLVVRRAPARLIRGSGTNRRRRAVIHIMLVLAMLATAGVVAMASGSIVRASFRSAAARPGACARRAIARGKRPAIRAVFSIRRRW
jgi:predicted Fe-S protein YdhL (DUF1289 family)